MRKITILILIILYSCCKDKCLDPSNPNCSNYDACFGKSYTAEFSMYQEFNYKASSEFINDAWSKDTQYRSEFFNTDTIPFYYNDKYVFEAKNKNAKSYQWKIGTDPRTRTESFCTIGFSGNEDKITITLIIEFDINDPCNKSKKQFDTLTKDFTLVDDPAKLPYIGAKYKIKNTVTSEERTIEFYKNFYKCNVNGSEGFISPSIVNLTDTFVFIPNGFNTTHYCSREVYFMEPRTCYFWSSKSSHDNKKIKGKMVFKSNMIFIEYNKLLHTIENNKITNIEESPFYKWEGFKL